MSSGAIISTEVSIANLSDADIAIAPGFHPYFNIGNYELFNSRNPAILEAFGIRDVREAGEEARIVDHSRIMGEGLEILPGV